MSIKKISLAQFVDVNPEGVTKSYPHDQIEYIDISSVGSGYLVESIRLLQLKEAPSRAKRIVRTGDTILSTVRPNLRSFLLIKDAKSNTIASTGFAVLRAKNNADPRFIYYAVTDSQFTGYLTNNTKGTSYPAVDSDTVLRGEVPDFQLPQQRRIASILSSYDDLIENNRRRIQLLEQSARLLYKEWFVNLRFPGHEHVKITDGVPEGWERKTLGGLCEEIRESVSPDSVEPDTPYIGLEHIPRRSIALNEWGTADQVTSSKHRFREGEILFGKIRPYFHKVGIALVDGVASSDAIVIRPFRDEWRAFVLMTVSSDGFVAVTAQTMKEGSKMPRADWKQMQQYLVPLPPEGVLAVFNSIIDPILQQLKTLSFENRNLSKARDILLPRLMSGEVVI